MLSTLLGFVIIAAVILPRSLPRQPQKVLRVSELLTDETSGLGRSTMRIRRLLRAVSTFFTQLAAALLRAVVTSAVVGLFLVCVMQYMGVPVPKMHELLGGISRLAEILS